MADTEGRWKVSMFLVQSLTVGDPGTLRFSASGKEGIFARGAEVI